MEHRTYLWLYLIFDFIKKRISGHGTEKRIKALIEQQLAGSRATYRITLDGSDGAGVSWLHRNAEVLAKNTDDDGRMAVTVRADPAKANIVRTKFGLATAPIAGQLVQRIDPRFVLMKPAIGHFAIGVIMLKRGWMLRYMPAIVTETIPEYVTAAGYAWAALCFVLGAGTIAVAMTGDMKLWTFYVTVVLVGAKIAAFAIQYATFRFLVGSRIRAAARA